MILSKKQIALYNDIISPFIPEISVLGSTQSGKTHCIDFSFIQYAKELQKYEQEQRKNKDYVPRDYYGAIIGWTTDTIKSNIIEPLEKILTNEYHFTNGKEYVLKYGQQDKYLDIYGMRFYFFGFNTNLSFNRILGKPLIFVWVDESARIYSSNTLQESFDEIPGRMMSYSGHPYYKRIDSYNVEGNDNHPYKVKYIDNKDSKKYVFFPYDNPVLDTEDKIRQACRSFTGTLREQKVFNKWVIAEGKVFNKINKIKSMEGLVIREIGIGIDYGSVNPTTEYYSKELKMFILLLKDKYANIPITDIVIDSEASHFDNRLITDGIKHTLSRKGSGSVDEGVQHLQSLLDKEIFYILEEPSIRFILPDGRYEEDVVDRSLLEFDSYQYDRVKSANTGVNCYKKELDHCLVGETIVSTTKGDIPIKELVNTEGKVYTYENGVIVEKEYYNCHKTMENVDIYELELDNGYKIRGTSDHPILTTRGYVLLSELTEKDEILYV